MILSVVLLAAAATAAAPDHAHASAPASSPVPLFNDLGTYHRTISTKNPTAQKYFDQGLRLVYGFNHDEAERAFREAVRLDPGLVHTDDVGESLAGALRAAGRAADAEALARYQTEVQAR